MNSNSKRAPEAARCGEGNYHYMVLLEMGEQLKQRLPWFGGRKIERPPG
jgi:hypothetical protein